MVPQEEHQTTQKIHMDPQLELEQLMIGLEKEQSRDRTASAKPGSRKF